MNQVNYQPAVKTNSFSVYRVYNGWIVEMPKINNVMGQENPYEGLVPVMRDLLKLQNEDPLLSELKGKDVDEWV